MRSLTSAVGAGMKVSPSTQLMQSSRCLSASTAYPRCASCESVLHVLCDCPYVHTVWSASLGSLLPATFFANNLDVWLLSSLRSSSPTPYPDVPWSILFASTCWHIWKTRNDLIFTGFVAPTDSTAARSINWSRHYSMVSSKITSRPIVRVDTPCRWLPPPSPWIPLRHFDMIRLDAPPDYLQSQLEQDNGSFYGLSAA
ncbi:hypothetical protein V6N13_117744 [Hibiscus sabdariffa]